MEKYFILITREYRHMIQVLAKNEKEARKKAAKIGFERDYLDPELSDCYEKGEENELSCG